MEVILRAEAVETAQAGDRCDFTGTMIVVPDVGSLSLPGKTVLNSKRSRQLYFLKASSDVTSQTRMITSCAGARAETGARPRGNQGYETEGVQGLKALGVRDLCYRTAFLASTVSPCNRKVSYLNPVQIQHQDIVYNIFPYPPGPDSNRGGGI